MNLKAFITLSFAVICMLFTPFQLEAAQKQEDKVKDVIDVLDAIMSIPEEGIPPALLSKAEGIAIIPEVLKVGFVIGGRYGTGVVLLQDSDGNWSNPVFVTFTGGSIGWQIGAQSTDVILVFKNARGLEDMLKHKFTLGADASVAAGPVGRHAEAGTDVQLKAEIYSYSRSRGLFAGISLEGSALSADADANSAFYYGKDATVQDIFSGKISEAPPVADKLKRILERYSK